MLPGIPVVATTEPLGVRCIVVHGTSRDSAKRDVQMSTHKFATGVALVADRNGAATAIACGISDVCAFYPSMNHNPCNLGRRSFCNDSAKVDTRWYVGINFNGRFTCRNLALVHGHTINCVQHQAA